MIPAAHHIRMYACHEESCVSGDGNRHGQNFRPEHIDGSDVIRFAEAAALQDERRCIPQDGPATHG